ncbi:MAG: hemerythrin domain-containing protein [Elusimicrobia bacterium]|nr:hemerythrin domain-containing protein [Elusimicrobiota bacterium]
MKGTPAPTRATDALLADHKMIRKLLTDFRLDNPRFTEILKTTHRIVVGHAWFEDAIFLPAVEKDRRLARRFTQEIYEEHQDLDSLLMLLRETPRTDRETLEDYLTQFATIMETHIRKEEDALFPIAARILDDEGQNRLGEEMRSRVMESRAAGDARFTLKP